MYEVTQETIDATHKPFDIVTNEKGDVGYICEVQVNSSQPTPYHQIGYAVAWMVGTETKHAWWKADELTVHCNMFVIIAEGACHPSGNSERHVKSLFNSMNY